MSCTSGKRENFSIQYSKSSNERRSFSPCTSCTILPPIKSIEGISMAASQKLQRQPVPLLASVRSTRRSEKYLRQAPHRPSLSKIHRQNAPPFLRLPRQSPEC